MACALPADGPALPIPCRCLVGRSPNADWQIQDSNVSHEHASIWWDGEGWWIRDLGSRNGTRVDGKPMNPGVQARLSQGQRLEFGGHSFQLPDLSPPEALARDLVHKTWHQAQSGLLVLPNAENPELTLFRGIDDQWRAETDRDVSHPVEQQVVVTGTHAFRLFLPVPPKGTTLMEALPLIEDVRLQLQHSADMEHIEAFAHVGNTRHDLGARAHNYLLLVLAQRRLEDHQNGASDSDCGWVYQDELERMIHASRKTLNLHVFRVRRSLCDLRVDGGAGIIERRSGNNQIRIGIAEITISKI